MNEERVWRQNRESEAEGKVNRREWRGETSAQKRKECVCNTREGVENEDGNGKGEGG